MAHNVQKRHPITKYAKNYDQNIVKNGAMEKLKLQGIADQNDIKVNTTAKHSAAYLIQDPISSQYERELNTSIKERLGNKPEAKKAYEDLLKTPLFSKKRLGISDSNRNSCIAIMEQVKNYPEKRVIENLNRLQKLKWFKVQTPADKQRTAKLVALNSTNEYANKVTLNTLDRILNNENRLLFWKDKLEDISDKHDLKFKTYIREHIYGPIKRKTEIYIDRELIPSGPAPVKRSKKETIETLIYGLASHVSLSVSRNNRFVSNYTENRFINFYRSWYVGKQAQNNEPPTAKQSYEIISKLVYNINTKDSIVNAAIRFNQAGLHTPFSHKPEVIRFMKNLVGMDISNIKSGEEFKDAWLKVKKSDLKGKAPEPISFNNEINSLDNSLRSSKRTVLVKKNQAKSQETTKPNEARTLKNKKVKSSKARATTRPQLKIHVVTPNIGARIRSGPTTDSKVLGVTQPGAFAREYGTRKMSADGKEWVQIKTTDYHDNFVVGWMRSDLLKPHDADKGRMNKTGRMNPSKHEDTNYKKVVLKQDYSLWHVAKDYKVNYEELYQDNKDHILNRNTLYKGDTIYLRQKK